MFFFFFFFGFYTRFYSPGKFYCKPHYCYRVSGYAQRKRPAPSPAPATAKVLCDSVIHFARVANMYSTPCSVRLHRRTRRPKQEWWLWMPPEGQRRCPPSSSHPQVAHFRVLPRRLLPAVWPRARSFHCVASSVHFPGLATRWHSTP